MIIHTKEDKFGYKQIADKIKDQSHLLERIHLAVEEMKALVEKRTTIDDTHAKAVDLMHQEMERINYTLQLLTKQQIEILSRLNSPVRPTQNAFENYVPLTAGE